MLPRYGGSALVYVLVIMFVVSIIFSAMVTFIVSQLKFSFYQAEREQAFQIAEAGIDWYRWYLAHETAGKTAQQIQEFWDSVDPGPYGVGTPYEVSYGGGDYSISVQKPDPGSTIVMVTSTGWVNQDPSAKRIIQVRFRRPSWSEYLFLSNSFMNFGTEATVYGKVFSNYGIRFDGHAYNTVSALPVSFNDPTWGGNNLQFGVHTTVNPADPNAPSYPWPAGTVPDRPDVFAGGRQFPSPAVSFTGVTADLANMKTQAQSGNGYYFDSSGLGRRILFNSDGTFTVCTVKSANSNTHAISRYYATSGSGTCTSCSGSCATNYPIPNNGIIFVENNAWVDGTINNDKVTVAAANLSGGGNQADIYIGSSAANLTYASFDCNNMLGLVAQHDVRVLSSCPNNYVVDAALLAQDGTVGINNNGSFGAKNSMTFNGAIVSYLEPYFVNGNNGFGVRTYNFNNNLLYCPPPYFPTGTQYSIDLWKEL